MASPQSKQPPSVSGINEKFCSLKEIPTLLHLTNINIDTDSEKVRFCDSVRWVRVDTFGCYHYRQSRNDNEPWKSVSLSNKKTTGNIGAVGLPMRMYAKSSVKAVKLSDLAKHSPFIGYHSSTDTTMDE